MRTSLGGAVRIVFSSVTWTHGNYKADEYTQLRNDELGVQP